MLLLTIATVVPARRLFWLVRQTILADRPIAKSMLDHFVSGSGEPRNVSFEKILQQDTDLKKYIEAHVCQALQQGYSSGQVFVPQNIVQNRDLRFFLGSFNCDWRSVGAEVELGFRKQYKWSPDEKRLSQAVHRAGDRLIEKGLAKPFEIIGDPVKSTPFHVGASPATTLANRPPIFLM